MISLLFACVASIVRPSLDKNYLTAESSNIRCRQWASHFLDMIEFILSFPTFRYIYTVVKNNVSPCMNMNKHSGSKRPAHVPSWILSLHSALRPSDYIAVGK